MLYRMMPLATRLDESGQPGLKPFLKYYVNFPKFSKKHLANISSGCNSNKR